MNAKIYVPIKRNAYVRDLGERIANRFGGATIIPNCLGIWIKDKTQPIEDKITIIETYFDERNINQTSAKEFFKYIASIVKQDLKQDSVAYCINNDIYFV